MNERIKKLAEQATVKICFRVDPNSYKHIDDPDGEFDRFEFDKQKFAELIIKECLTVVESQRDPYSLNYSPKSQTASDIKYHFGLSNVSR